MISFIVPEDWQRTGKSLISFIVPEDWQRTGKSLIRFIVPEDILAKNRKELDKLYSTRGHTGKEQERA